MEQLYRTYYNTLPQEEKQAVLQKIGENYQMTLKRFEEFSNWGQSTYTAVYEYENSEFVFVPGDMVTLGWDGFSTEVDPETISDIQSSFDDFGLSGPVEDYLRESTTPVRKTTIKPMLVERNLNTIGWIPLAMDDPSIQNQWAEELNEFQEKDYASYEVDKEIKFVRHKGGEISAYSYQTISYLDFLKQLSSEGFELPTEDEWEYLCGGGRRTLFAWGDSFDFSMHVHHFEEPEDLDKPYDMELPNMFGLSIAYDPYLLEVVKDKSPRFKGGDGGVNVCGGMGVVLGYLPCSPYYAAINDPETNMSDDYMDDIGGDYTFFRRVLHIEKI